MLVWLAKWSWRLTLLLAALIAASALSMVPSTGCSCEGYGARSTSMDYEEMHMAKNLGLSHELGMTVEVLELEGANLYWSLKS